tara:strand:- start:292 stop:1152 length:861 start_codon:yes stop_codon:yes gene_type:complete
LLIASWNVNSIRTRANQVLNWLINTNVDILCLQETKVIDEDFPLKIFEDIGYRSIINGQKSYNGVAILSKNNIEVSDVRYGFTGELTNKINDEVLKSFDNQKRIISGLFNDVRVVNVYVPNGSSINSEKFGYKINWLNLLSNYLINQEKREELTCLMGDFNIALQNEDIHDPEKYAGNIMASDIERDALNNILKGRFIDSFRVFEKLTGFWSWWDYRNNAYDLNKGWRIDHIYISNNLLPKLKSSVIMKDQRENPQPSDHAPVLVNLDFEEFEENYEEEDEDFFEL